MNHPIVITIREPLTQEVLGQVLIKPTVDNEQLPGLDFRQQSWHTWTPVPNRDIEVRDA